MYFRSNSFEPDNKNKKNFQTTIFMVNLSVTVTLCIKELYTRTVHAPFFLLLRFEAPRVNETWNTPTPIFFIRWPRNPKTLSLVTQQTVFFLSHLFSLFVKKNSRTTFSSFRHCLNWDLALSIFFLKILLYSYFRYAHCMVQHTLSFYVSFDMHQEPY